MRRWTLWGWALVAVAAGCGDETGGGSAAGGAAGSDAATGGRPGAGGADGGGPRTDAVPAWDVGVTDGGGRLDGSTGGAAPGDGGPAGGDARPGRGFWIEPREVELLVGDGDPPTVQLRAKRGIDGRVIDVPAAEVDWTVEPAELGAVDPATGLFTAAGPLGDARVFGRHEGDLAASTIHLLGDDAVLEPGTPADAPDRFAAAPEAEDCAPRVEYPVPFTAFPRNIQGVTFQWEAAGHTLFEAAFSARGQTTRWYTTRTEVTPGGAHWNRLLSLAAGGELRFRLRGLGGRGGDACATEEQIYLIDTSTLQGAIYYWSTTDAGIMRLAAGETEPEPFLTPAVAPEINCPACHALSRDGSRIAFTRTTFPPFGDLMVSSIDAPRRPAYDPAGVVGYFPSWAPDARRIVAGAGGRLVIRDADTGQEIDHLPLPEDTVGGSPDWSWDGSAIVAVLGPRGLNPLPDAGVNRGSIARWILGADGAWGPPEILVEQAGDVNNDRPAWSPDGRFIAFNRVGPDPNQDTQGNPNTDLWLLDTERGGAPIELANANAGEGLGNSWPKWSPISGAGRRWLAFSSLRDYGHLLRNSGREHPRPQIWVTGIDPRQADEGLDPSAPAFWLPYQSIESGNHIPYWAVYEKEPTLPDR